MTELKEHRGWKDKPRVVCGGLGFSFGGKDIGNLGL